MTSPKLAQYGNENEGDGRSYRHPRLETRVPSVTTVLKMADKGGLPQWASDLALHWAVNNPDALYGRDAGDAFRAGRFQWKKVRDERAWIGNETHDYIESVLTGKDEPPVFDTEALSAIAQWNDWYWAADFKPLHVETTAWSEKYGYAGTLDWIAELDGKVTLGDWKTSKNVFDDHKRQLAGLANADYLLVEGPEDEYTEVPIPEIEQYALVQVRPDYYDPLKETFTPGFVEVHYVPNAEIPYYYEQFLGFLRAWYGDRDLKMFRKGQ